MTIKEVSQKYNISQDTLRYYERVGMIPKVTRTASGIRDYQESDLSWVELPVEALIEYVELYQQGDQTFSARLELLQEQRRNLEEQQKQLQAAISKLDYKISRYEVAVKTGKLSWEENSCT